MIRFVTSRGHSYTLDALRRDPRAPRLEVISYDRLIKTRRAAGVTHVFVDQDRLASWDLELAAAAYGCLKRAGVAVLNDPARVRTRFSLLRALHEAGLNDFNAYRLDEGLWPERYPVFLRRSAGHGLPVTDLLNDRDALESAVDAALEGGVPASSLIVVEYAAEPAAPGIYRKLAMHRVGDRLVPELSVHDGQWLVKYGRHGFATPELYEEEARFLRKSPHADHLARAFEIAGIEWGRADFGLVQGRVQVWEINTNPQIGRVVEAHPSATRIESGRLVSEQICAGLHAIDALAPGRGLVDFRDRRLGKARRGLNRFVRTRFMA